jgi:hypothetical protein
MSRLALRHYWLIPGRRRLLSRFTVGAKDSCRILTIHNAKISVLPRGAQCLDFRVHVFADRFRDLPDVLHDEQPSGRGQFFTSIYRIFANATLGWATDLWSKHLLLIIFAHFAQPIHNSQVSHNSCNDEKRHIRPIRESVDLV